METLSKPLNHVYMIYIHVYRVRVEETYCSSGTSNDPKNIQFDFHVLRKIVTLLNGTETE